MKVNPLTNVAPQSLNDLRNKIREGKRQRAKEYRSKKKQQEKDWKNNILSLESQNKSLEEEVARLKREKAQILEDHAQILEDLNHCMAYHSQPLTQTYFQGFTALTHYPVYHRPPMNDETQTLTKWNFEAIEELPTEALLSIQGDINPNYEDNDVINNQETTPHMK